MLDTLITDWRSRPWWMNLMFYFCVYMTFIYMPFDIFYKPVAEDEEVWFGYMLTGWWAKATAPIHWFIYGAGAYGFWRRKSWMWPWAAVYSMQVVIAMIVWNLLYPEDAGLGVGLIAGAVFMVPTIALWRKKEFFQSGSVSEQTTG